MPVEWYDIFATFGFINLCVNPLIYAARYEVFRKTLNKMLNKDNTVATLHT